MDTGDTAKTIYMRTKDAFGNISSDSIDSIILDTTAPVFTGTTFINWSGIVDWGSYYTSWIAITFTDSNLSWATLTSLTSSWTTIPYTSGQLITIPGIYFFEVYDLAGNMTGITFTIKQAVCGNSLVEPGETCDAGTDNGKAGNCNLSCNGSVPLPSWWGGGSLTKDQCRLPSRLACANSSWIDYSNSYYDQTCCAAHDAAP